MHPVVLEKKSQIALACERNNVARLDVFGSAARGNDFAPDRSDVDFLVEFGEAGGEDRYLTLKEEFERILDRQVDLLDRKALDCSRNYIRRKSILAHTEVVYIA